MSVTRSGNRLDPRLVTLAEQAEVKALAWVTANLPQFNPLTHTDLRRFKLAIKAVSELALVCSLGFACERRSSRPHAYREISAFIWQNVFKNEAMQEYLLTNATGLPSFSLYVSLYQCGYDDANYRAALEELLDDEYITAVENTPSVQLDFVYNLEMSGLPLGRHSAEELFRQSFLAKHPGLYPLTTGDAYAITHTIFFITSFGRRNPIYLTAGDLNYFRTALPRLLQFFLRRGNLDLSAELLLALRSLGVDQVPVFEEGWALLVASQDEDGSFAGPETEEMEGYGETLTTGAKQNNEAQSDAGWIRFRDNYHTTLAFLLAFESTWDLPGSPVVPNHGKSFVNHSGQE